MLDHRDISTSRSLRPVAPYAFRDRVPSRWDTMQVPFIFSSSLFSPLWSQAVGVVYLYNNNKKRVSHWLNINTHESTCISREASSAQNLPSSWSCHLASQSTMLPNHTRSIPYAAAMPKKKTTKKNQSKSSRRLYRRSGVLLSRPSMSRYLPTCTAAFVLVRLAKQV